MVEICEIEEQVEPQALSPKASGSKNRHNPTPPEQAASVPLGSASDAAAAAATPATGATGLPAESGGARSAGDAECGGVGSGKSAEDLEGTSRTQRVGGEREDAEDSPREGAGDCGVGVKSAVGEEGRRDPYGDAQAASASADEEEVFEDAMTVEQQWKTALARAEALKQEGNVCYGRGDFAGAVQLYSRSLEECPAAPPPPPSASPSCPAGTPAAGPTSEARTMDESNGSGKPAAAAAALGASAVAASEPAAAAVNADASMQAADVAAPALDAAAAPAGDAADVHHPSAEELASLTALKAACHSNRAICFINLGEYDAAVTESSTALQLQPTYAKALLRRAQAFEKLDKLEEALADAQKVVELDASQKAAAAMVKKLQPLVEERREKLKEEMLGKLKDLGNSVLGHFGLSLDNFKAVKDPNTGSYSISFQN